MGKQPDVNQVAARIVAEATGQVEKSEPPQNDDADEAVQPVG